MLLVQSPLLLALLAAAGAAAGAGVAAHHTDPATRGPQL